MNVTYVNTAVVCWFIIILIFIDYLRKYNTDHFRRGIFFVVLAAAFVAVSADFIHHGLLMGRPGKTVTLLIYAVVSVFYAAQNCAYYMGAVFIDYFANGSIRRSKRIIAFLAAFLFLHILSIIGNLYFRYYFYVSPENYYMPGPLYALRLVISYFSIILYFVIILAGQFHKHQIFPMIFFTFSSGFGAALDIILETSSLLWPCFSASLLYLYFFIVLTDSKIDSLTGLGNRTSFNEFIDKLERRSSKDSYSLVIIDMDGFKAINDTLGHLEGDHALKDMAGIIKNSVRRTDFAARFGGDEFILAARAEHNILVILERIQKAMDDLNENGNRPYKLRMSYGHGVFTTNTGQNFKDFLKQIDDMMYKNKETNRKCRR